MVKKNKIENEAQKVERIFVLDEETKSFFTSKDGGEMVLSESELRKITDYKADLKAIIILAELEWQGKYLQHFYGFDLAVELRRKHKLLCPIIITSTLSQSYFSGLAQNKIDIKYKLLFGRGTGFLPFCELNTTLEKTVESLYKFPLSNAVLTDMNEMLLNQKGLVIDKLTHDLKFGIESTKLNEILTDVSNYLNTSQRIEIEWETSIKNLNDNVRDFVKFNKTVYELIRNCERILINDSKPADNISERKHKMLVLEDDPDFQKVIEENLKSHFEELLITGSAEKAIELLQDDGRNEITGIISDWRLYADPKEKSYWQLQGYEVLDYAAKNRLIALFALTSLSDRNVHNIRNTLGLDIHLFKKQHLETADSKVQWEMMADTVKQKCDAILDLIASDKNMGESWFKSEERNKNGELTAPFTSLRGQYLQKRSKDWATFEMHVSKRADLLWDYYKGSLDPVKNRALEDFGKKFGIQFEKSGIPILENVLIIRRIWLALWFNNTLLDIRIDGQEMPEVKIYCVLRNSYLDELIKKGHMKSVLSNDKKQGKSQKFNATENEKSVEEDILNKLKNSAKKNLANTALCIQFDRLPKGILPEEKSWLLRTGIRIEDGNDLFDKNAKNEILENEETDIDPTTLDGQSKLNELGKAFSKFDGMYD